MTDGCLAAGRSGGPLYIDWYGTVMPCIFLLHYIYNILEMYDKGGTLNLPSPSRDHHLAIYEILKEHDRTNPRISPQGSPKAMSHIMKV